MKLLTKTEIINCADITPQEVEVPEWGGAVLLQPMTGAERDEFEMLCQSRQVGKVMNTRGIKVNLLCRVLRNPSDPFEPMFTSKELTELNGKNAKPINDLFVVAQKLCGISEEDASEMEKNLPSTDENETGTESQE